MSTFEIVKERILSDMSGLKVHNNESWSQILLTHTARLHDVKEQEKFWKWFTNPYGEDREPMQFTYFDNHEQIDMPQTTTMEINDPDDEKSTTEIELENTYERNGLGVYHLIKPKRES